MAIGKRDTSGGGLAKLNLTIYSGRLLPQQRADTCATNRPNAILTG